MKLKMKIKKCIICGFDKHIHRHHIIKKYDYGSDEDDNIVTLCPNHHWVADWGNEKDKKEILKQIKEKTGKIGSLIPKEKINEIEGKIIDLIIKQFNCPIEEALNMKNDAVWFNYKVFIINNRR